MRSLLTSSLVVCAALAALPAVATPFHMQTFTNVAIADRAYNVTFKDMAFNDLPSSDQVPTFTTVASALEALNAIVNYAGSPSYSALASQASIPTNPYRSVIVPIRSSYARNPASGDFTSVYQGVGLDGVPSSADNYELDANINYNFYVPFADGATVFPGGLTIATFSVVTPAAVPEPASIALLAIGLFGIAQLRHRAGLGV